MFLLRLLEHCSPFPLLPELTFIYLFPLSVIPIFIPLLHFPGTYLLPLPPCMTQHLIIFSSVYQLPFPFWLSSPFLFLIFPLSVLKLSLFYGETYQGHLHPLLEAHVPAGNRTRACAVDGEHSSKELFEQIVSNYSELYKRLPQSLWRVFRIFNFLGLANKHIWNDQFSDLRKKTEYK